MFQHLSIYQIKVIIRMMKAWHMLLVVLGLVDQVFSHEQTCVSPKGEVGDYIVKNCKVKYCQKREDRHFGRWRTVSKYEILDAKHP